MKGDIDMKNFIKIFTLIAFFAPSLSIAHPGRTAGDGCHYCRTNCDKWGVPWGKRHCHGRAESPIEKVSNDNLGDELLIKESDFGDKWPFTVTQGFVKCFGPHIVTFENSGKNYALNGNARARLEKFNLIDINEIRRDHPKSPKSMHFKISVAPVIAVGLKSCTRK